MAVQFSSVLALRILALAAGAQNAHRVWRDLSINQSIEKIAWRLLLNPERQRLTIKSTRSKQFNKSTIKPRKLYNKI